MTSQGPSARLRTFPNEAAVETLERLGVDYVIAHTNLYPAGAWVKVEERLRAFEARLVLVHEERNDRVYRLVSGGLRPAAATAR